MAVVDLYKALGGGWEIQGGSYGVSPETREEMERRTNWDDYFVDDSDSEGESGD